MRFKRVVITGISGAGATDVAKAFCEKRDIDHIDVGSLIEDVAKQSGTGLTGQNVLQAPPDTLKLLSYAASQQLLERLTDSEQPAMIDTHLVFLRTTGLIEGMSQSSIDQIAPNAFISIIDGPGAIHSRLKAEPRRYFQLTITDIVKWQEFEVYLTNLHARQHKCPHLVVPFNEAVEALDGFLMQDKEKIYASYPMTNLPAESLPRRDAFVAKLKQRFTVFNPAAIESAHDRQPFYSPEDYQAIENHTITRDLDWFIRLNECTVVAYMVPGISSSGSNDELRFAYEIGRPTYLVIDDVASSGGTTRLSPFTTYKAMIFQNQDSFFKYWDLTEVGREAHRICVETIRFRRAELICILATQDRLRAFTVRWTRFFGQVAK